MIKKILLLTVLIMSTIVFAQTAPTVTWISNHTTLEIGKNYTFSASYDAGNDGAGTNYTVGKPGGGNILQYSIQLKNAAGSSSWKAGVNDATATGTNSGTSTKAWTIPATIGNPAVAFPTSAQLAPGEYYVLRVGFQNSNLQWSSGAVEQNITIVAPSGDAWSWDASPMSFNSATSLAVPIKYTSDTDIAVDGIKFIFWTETRGTVNDVNLFSDVWHGAVTNSTVLPAGTNVSAILNVNVPAALINSSTGSMYLSSELGPVFDPNAGDAGNNYVNHASTPAPTYIYMFRIADGTDPNFTPVKPNTTDFTVTTSLGLKKSNLSEINVFPNPTSDYVTLPNIDGVKTISIVNSLGQIIKSIPAQKTIDLSGLKKGVYLLKTDNGQSAKIIKK
ncbi:T9SS type A sorting domain-containing protein [Flavobacterium ovatum]|uniref:T9SS type A sorting domain-containing protein n=1 Tax=Flavobacterium ovatum TaxID=1928857 RepID=UPI00345107EC